MSVKISIIVPIYKVEKYLAKCIDSILNQTFKEYELILVNDGSPDSCGEICEEYSKRDKRVKVIHKKNGGLSSARNAGIDIAKGEYIAFVDSDDFIHKNMYEMLYKNAINTSSDIVICDYFIVSENEIIQDESYQFKIQPKTFTNIEVLRELYRDDRIKFVVAWNKLYKKSLFSKLRYKEGRIHEDEFIIHKILYECSKVTYLPVKLYFYLQTDNSIIRSPYNIKRLDRVYALKERVEFFKKIKQLKLQHHAESKYIQSLFANYKNIRMNNIPLGKELIKLRLDLLTNITTLAKNPYYKKKEKLMWLIFIINPLLYDWYMNKFSVRN
ncbi:glycosyltransferase family 2 protein [Metabacillus litoralis]|uniref:glycosyltransferase family 2 protein n=1 Tax=Metabacillus litoralis TaxID=152268 RepID=UPI0020407E3F|nr:glycosyltransferase [Metabacillus litoralis]MCM3412438.1 glycosyltransferase [Metabacillus litoralis]